MPARMEHGLGKTTLLLAILLGSGAKAETWHADPISGCTVHDDDNPQTKVVISWSGECDANGRASGQAS
jgi:hypothetical protein